MKGDLHNLCKSLSFGNLSPFVNGANPLGFAQVVGIEQRFMLTFIPLHGSFQLLLVVHTSI